MAKGGGGRGKRAGAVQSEDAVTRTCIAEVQAEATERQAGGGELSLPQSARKRRKFRHTLAAEQARVQADAAKNQAEQTVSVRGGRTAPEERATKAEARADCDFLESEV